MRVIVICGMSGLLISDEIFFWAIVRVMSKSLSELQFNVVLLTINIGSVPAKYSENPSVLQVRSDGLFARAVPYSDKGGPFINIYNGYPRDNGPNKNPQHTSRTPLPLRAGSNTTNKWTSAACKP